jgi:1-deoxy-D-xylulose-5-phosphate reductoisomerase
VSPAICPRRLILLGSTGSIGVNTLAVIDHLRSQNICDFQVAGLAAGSNSKLLREQAHKFNVKHIALANGDEDGAGWSRTNCYVGPDAALQLVNSVARPGDLLVGAMVGSAGVAATLAAIDRGCDIALANKETLVAAGELVMPRVRLKQANLLPIDSEHSAIFQCLRARPSIDSGSAFDSETWEQEVRRIVITGSGGPFRTWSRPRIASATVEEALNHPTWTMGPKITIDSASLMNKALEVIEAHWLFGLPADKIEVIIHPQSIIHSFVEYVDGSILAQLGPPDMRTPIQFALTWPHRLEGASRKLEWSELRRMDFEPVDHERFPALRLAYEVIKRGGTSGAILNAANEAAVAAFLARQIPFGRITELVSQSLTAIPTTSVRDLGDVLEADRRARDFVTARIQATSPVSAPA